MMMAIAVVLVGTFVGGVCGWIADKWLGTEDWVLPGVLFGLLAGWAAGVVWSRIMVKRIMRAHRPHKDLRAMGARWGMLVGLGAAMVVFVWLFLHRDPNSLFHGQTLLWWLIAELFGGVVGAGVGYLCGWLAYIAAKIALPLPPVDPKNYPQRSI
jgi:Na+/H+ antiporter NhaA